MTNRLVTETSPYLLQHADNPVDWYPWCDDALQKAKLEDKPIFLSIGYSACHWCHVMEHESFEDPKIAQILNENFISIKVDREERPDLDQIYMNAVVAMNQGQGGWPLSAFLTPEQNVFFGGTYWPPREKNQLPGFDQVLLSVLDAFIHRREAVDQQSQQVSEWLNRGIEVEKTKHTAESLLQNAAQSFEPHFDFKNGGFGSAPKFPQAICLQLMMVMADARTDNDRPSRSRLMEMVQLNLEKMAMGGIYDHLSGGFARYSVDERWLVPHFEKMLYDNALLATVYLEAFRRTDESTYAKVAQQTLDYLRSYMTDDASGIYSSEDADSEGQEGKFYVWTVGELESVLGPEDARLFCDYFDVTANGNFEGSNILNTPVAPDMFSDEQLIPLKELKSRIHHLRKKVLEARDQRVRPSRDEKILVSWNALAIHAFAKASYLLEDPRFLDSAINAADFILSSMRNHQGRLLHSYRLGEAKINGFLDDHTYLLQALLELYKATFDERWIDHSFELIDPLLKYFRSDSGGFFFTPSDHEALIARTEEFQDSSVPSSNAMAATTLLKLGRLTGRQNLIEIADAIIQRANSLMERAPMSSGQMLLAAESSFNPPSEFVLIGPATEEMNDLQKSLRQATSDKSILVSVKGTRLNPSRFLDDALKDKPAVDQQPTLYVCRNYSCAAPIVGFQAIQRKLDNEGF